jgi:hypothetical protein
MSGASEGFKRTIKRRLELEPEPVHHPKEPLKGCALKLRPIANRRSTSNEHLDFGEANSTRDLGPVKVVSRLVAFGRHADSRTYRGWSTGLGAAPEELTNPKHGYGIVFRRRG